MAKIFITLTGTKHYFGNDFLEKVSIQIFVSLMIVACAFPNW